MTTINTNTAITVSAQQVPCETPKSIELTADFTSNDAYEVNLLNAIQQGIIDRLQAIYVDNPASQQLVFRVAGSGQRINFPAQSQGFLPVFFTDSPQMSFTCTDTTAVCRIWLLNYPVVPYIWDIS